ncbi:unnamed protein product [Vitrella brassicaformis CCMP3155]|uniref:Uncharacterized protein n=1 Tax=Vitrella brassicaformis (strain CCMP3155) TaxID=1169540 RepID=A0A0G4GNM5_VITBC|nr:unnamed protein product [Vitrella brassicaformis CCMP3155]|eukprot:CEM31903.1 unnamed protein product [Vitrella brassicaformis CCMP3155]
MRQVQTVINGSLEFMAHLAAELTDILDTATARQQHQQQHQTAVIAPPQQMGPFARRVAAFCVPIPDQEIEDQTRLGQRVNAAIRRFTAAAAHAFAASDGEAPASVSSLMCFVLGQPGGPQVGVREVVVKSIADEAARHGLTIAGLPTLVPTFDLRDVGYVRRVGGSEAFEPMHLESLTDRQPGESPGLANVPPLWVLNWL